MSGMTTAEAARINRGQVVVGILFSGALIVFLMSDDLASADSALAKIVLWAGLAITATYALRGVVRQNNGNEAADEPHIVRQKQAALMVGFPVLAIMWSLAIDSYAGAAIFCFYGALTIAAATVNGPYRAAS